MGVKDKLHSVIAEWKCHIDSAATYAKSLIPNNAPTQVYFSPNGGCPEAIVKEITNAKNEILVQAYSFTSAPISNGGAK